MVGLLALLFTRNRILAQRREAKRSARRDSPRSLARAAFSSRAKAAGRGDGSLLYTISTAEGGRRALFRDFIVQPEYRGQGIGNAAAEYVIPAAPKGAAHHAAHRPEERQRAGISTRKLGFVNSSMQAMRLKLQKSSSA